MINPAASTWTTESLLLVEQWMAGFTPPAKLSVSAWAEQNLVLPPDTNAEPGELRLTPYQAQMIDALADPRVRIAVLMLASQTGKSLSIDSFMLNRMRTAPGPMLLVQPTDGKARAFVKERLNPLVKNSPKLRGMFGTGRRAGDGDGDAFKAFAGGYLAVASSHKTDDLAGRSIKYLFVDELDRFALSAGQEGSPELLALKRQHTFRGKKLAILASTPTDELSRIAKWHLRGDQRRFEVPCSDCATFAPLSFDRLKWTPGEPESAYLSCPHCAGRMNDRQRRAALDLGQWRASADGEPGVISFQANVLVSSFTDLATVAQDAEASNASPEARRVFVNTSMAEIYIPEATSLEVGALMSRAIPIATPYPVELRWITLGCDVQGDRLECTVLGHSKDGQSAVLWHHVLPGSVNSQVPWEALEEIMASTFATVDGRLLSVGCTAVDAGYLPDRVADFVAEQRAKGRQIKPTIGRDGFQRPPITRGAKNKRHDSVMIVGVDPLKESIVTRLHMREPGPGYIHLNSLLDTEYYDGLAAERLTTKYVRGFPRKEWVKTRRRNEPLDCLVYAFAVLEYAQKFQSRAPFDASTDYSINKHINKENPNVSKFLN